MYTMGQSHAQRLRVAKALLSLVGRRLRSQFKELLEDTPWDKYGNSSNPKCAQCMAHCGYEATAVEDMLQHPVKALLTSIRGPKTTGPMVAEPSPAWESEEPKLPKTLAGIPVKVQR